MSLAGVPHGEATFDDADGPQDGASERTQESVLGQAPHLLVAFDSFLSPRTKRSVFGKLEPGAPVIVLPRTHLAKAADMHVQELLGLQNSKVVIAETEDLESFGAGFGTSGEQAAGTAEFEARGRCGEKRTLAVQKGRCKHVPIIVRHG